MESKYLTNQFLFVMLGFNVICANLSICVGEEASNPTQLEFLTESIPPFVAVWSLDRKWSADPAMANYLTLLRDAELQSYQLPKGSEAERELKGVIAEDANLVREGKRDELRVSLKFFTKQKIAITIEGPTWPKPIEFYCPGNGISMRVDHMSKSVMIERFDLKRHLQYLGGVPGLVLSCLANPDMRFHQVARNEDVVTFDSKLKGPGATGIYTDLAIQLSPDSAGIQEILEYRTTVPSASTSSHEKLSSRTSFAEFVRLEDSAFYLPGIAIDKRVFGDGRKVLDSSWKLEDLRRLNIPEDSADFSFPPGYSVIDERTDPPRTFSSDDILQPKQ